MVTHRRRPTLQLGAEFLEPLAHIRVPHVHLAEEVVCQSSVIVQSAQVRAAHVADLQLLVARWPGCILQVLEITLEGFLLMLCGPDFVHLVQGHCDGARLAQHRDFEEARVDGVCQVGNLFQLENVS